MEPTTTALVVGTGVQVIGGILGGNRAANAAAAQADRQNEATMRQYDYDMKKWEMDKEMIKQNRNFAMEEIRIKALNENRRADFQDASNAQQYEYQLKIRDRQQASNEAQFERSTQIYNQQLSLNERSAQTATENEYRQLEEIHTEMAFDRQDAYLQNLINEGKLRARGVTGRSAMKGYQATAADTGRQMAMLNESFSAAGRNTRAVLAQIATDKASADLAAYAQKMLDPGVLPDPLKPLDTPRAQFVMPRALGEFDFGPKPVLGAMADPSAAAGRVWGSTISGIAGSVGGALNSAAAAGVFK